MRVLFYTYTLRLYRKEGISKGEEKQKREREREKAIEIKREGDLKSLR